MLTTQEVRVDYFITSEKKLAHLLTTVGGFLSAASGALLPPHLYDIFLVLVFACM
jgi:hypothetical protein